LASTFLVGIACYFLLTNTPQQAKWLTEREKTVVGFVLTSDRSGGVQAGHSNLGAELRQAFGDPRVWILAFIYFTTACANYTFTFWLPTMVRNLGVTDIAQIGWYTSDWPAKHALDAEQPGRLKFDAWPAG